MQPLPSLRQLSFFRALVRRKSFSVAAADCAVSQSALSTAIMELEKICECVLVDRSTRDFVLTPHGQILFERAEEILARSEDMMRAVSQRRPMDGSFRLGVIPTIGPFILPTLTPHLVDAYPNLQLFLREDLSESLIDMLSSSRLDAILLAFPFKVPGADILEIGEDPFYFAARADHALAEKAAITSSDLSGTNLLLLEDGHCLRDHALSECNLRKEAAATFEATSLMTLVEMVRMGLGTTLLPKIAVDSGIARSDDIRLIPFKEPAPSRKIGIAWRRGSGRSDEAQIFAEFVAAYL